MQHRLTATMGALAGADCLALPLAAAAADEPARRSLTVAPGQAVPLAVETAGKPDCSIGQVPETRVVVAPAHGEVTPAARRPQPRHTPSPAAAGYVVLYTPDADFNGDDMVTLEVSDMGTKTTYA